jgi:hypothetical protein
MTDRQIESLIKKLDLARIHRVMTILDWKWTMADGARVPSEVEIADRVESLVTQFASTNGDYASTCGFTMHRNKEGIEISFEISSAFQPI